jgi:hypothetical protein
MIRSTIFSLSTLAVLLSLGCGSGASMDDGSAGNGSGNMPSNPPLVVGIAPSAAPLGASATTIIAYGSNFAQGSNFKDAPAIQWNGTALLTTCVASNTLTPTACSSATAVTASVPASDLATMGTAKVAVANIEGTSNPFTFTITPAPAGSTWVRTVAGITAPNDIVSDISRGKLYVSVSSTDANAPNSIIAIDPVSGTAAAPVPAGSNPDPLSLSSDASYLWVGLDGSNSVQRFLLPGLTRDISFPLPLDSSGNPQLALALQAAPTSPHTVGLVAGTWQSTTPGNGVYVYDDATQRPTHVPGGSAEGGPVIDWIQWGPNDSTIYGVHGRTNDADGIADLNVSASGVSIASYNGGGLNAAAAQYDRGNGILYSYFGGAYDPAKWTQVGQFDLPLTRAATACTADSTLNRYYCVTTYSSLGTSVTYFELWVFDLRTYALINRTYFGSTIEDSIGSSVTGAPIKLVRWGNAGLALLSQTLSGDGNGGVFLIDGAAVNPNIAPDVSSGTSNASYASMNSLNPQSATAASGDVTVTIKGTGFSPDSTACWNCSYIQFQLLPTTYVSPTQLNVTFPIADLPANLPLEISVFDQGTNLFSSNALTFTVLPPSGSTQVTPLNLCGLSMAWDANAQLLYVGTADYDGAHPNSIVALDGNTGAIVKTQAVEPDPIFLSDGAGGKYLYAAYAGSTNFTQMALPGLNTTSSAVLNNAQGGPWLAGDMKAAPQSPDTAAVTLIKSGWQPEALGGIVIFDNGVARPGVAPGWDGGQTGFSALFDTLAWSSSDQLLASAPSAWDDGVSGPLYELTATPSGVAYLGQGTANFNTTGGYIHSDFGTGLIYSDDGSVADPNTGSIVGSYQASGLAAPDSSLNRVFILGQTASQANSTNFTIQSFDQKGFTPVSSITLSNLSGTPIQLVRWGTSGLAVLTSGGLEDVYENALGMLYLIQDASFVSNLPPASSTKATMKELVQQRSKRLSKRAMLKLAQQAARSRSVCCTVNTSSGKRN